MRWTAQRLQIFGVHFHVGVRHGERVVAIANGLAGYIPHLLALSASSPYWEGRDTGLASSRSKVFEGLPTAGLPHSLEDWADFERFMETLVSAGALSTIREVWWDIRPHPDFGTVELRMCDGIPTLWEVAALAALGQSLVTWLDQRAEAGRGRCSRRGLGPAPEQVAGRPLRHRRRPDRRLAGRAPALCPRPSPSWSPPCARSRCTLGCADELEGVLTILDEGPSYVRQRRLLAERRRPPRRRRPARRRDGGPPMTRSHHRPALDAFLDAHGEELVAFRRRLHAHPELSWAEHETTAAVRARLEVAGAAVAPLATETGLQVDLGDGTGPTVLLRADIDALPLDDEKDVPYRSTVPGVCHACGHDVHTTILLGAGLALQQILGPEHPGRVRLLFQPAEESMPGGAESLYRTPCSTTSMWSSPCTATRASRSARSACAPARSPRPPTGW